MRDIDESSLTPPEPDQDEVIYLMITDTDALREITYKNTTVRNFTGKDRQKLVNYILDFYQRYGRAPKQDLVDYIETKRRVGVLNDTDEELLILKLTDILKLNVDRDRSSYIIDKLDRYTKQRIAATTMNQLSALQGHTQDPEKYLELMRNAVNQVEVSSTRSLIEDITDDPLIDFNPRVMTRFNVPVIDSYLGGGFQQGNFGVLQAYTGRGKSWSIIHLAKIAVRLRRNVLVIINEMANRVWKVRWRMSITGMTLDELRQMKTTQIIELQERSMVGLSKLKLLTEEEKNFVVSDLERIVDETEQADGQPYDLILMDSADDLLPEPGNYRETHNRTTNIYTWLKNYSKSKDKCCITTAQSQRKGETTWWLNASNIGDDINKMRKATQGVSINALSGEIDAGYSRIYLFKNTDGPGEAKALITNDLARGQFVVNSVRYSHAGYMEELKKKGIDVFPQRVKRQV